MMVNNNKTLKEQYNILNEALKTISDFYHYESDEIVDRFMGKITIKLKKYFPTLYTALNHPIFQEFFDNDAELEKINNAYITNDLEEFVELLNKNKIEWIFLKWSEPRTKYSKEWYRYSFNGYKVSYSIWDDGTLFGHDSLLVYINNPKTKIEKLEHV